MQNHERVILVTGASSGIGAATAHLFYQQGWQVYGLSRSGKVPSGVHPLLADVTDLSTVKAAVRQMLEQEDRLDAVIHAAGIAGGGPVETIPPTEARKIIDTNFFGSVNVAQATLPVLRRMGKSKLLLIGSIAGQVAVPFYGIYSASKFAVDGLVESLRLELSATDVEVACVEPGDIVTPIIQKEYRQPVEDVPTIYHAGYQKSLHEMTVGVVNGYPVERVADLLYQQVVSTRPLKGKIRVGAFIQRIAPRLKRFLPTTLMEYIIRRIYIGSN